MIDLKLGELYTTRDESLVEAAKGILIDLIEAADWTSFSCEEYLQLAQDREYARLEDGCYGAVTFGKRSYVIAHGSITLAGENTSSCRPIPLPGILEDVNLISGYYGFRFAITKAIFGDKALEELENKILPAIRRERNEQERAKAPSGKDSARYQNMQRDMTDELKGILQRYTIERGVPLEAALQAFRQSALKVLFS